MTTEKKDLLLQQIRQEMDFARRYKQGKVKNWQKNESMYFGQKEKGEEARANVDLGRMQEHVHTLLSKIDSPLTFIFRKKKESQLRRVNLLNSLKDQDSDRDYWDIKDIVGKKQSIIYGRTIYSYSASSEYGYCPHLENVDVYDFLIDPAAGGIDLENGRYMGRYGVIKDRAELEEAAKKGVKTLYSKADIRTLLDGKGNNTEENRETMNKRNRQMALNHETSQKEISSQDKFVFWEWYTTFEGSRYYVLLADGGNVCIRVVPLTDLFQSNLWPFWTYAAFPDLTEFWTPSYCDYVREIFMAQSVSINQMLDNAEQINKPMKIVEAGAIENMAQLKYRKNGYITVKNGSDASRALKVIETPSITTPIEVFKVLENIQERASGVTAAAAGMEDTQGRATIYEGNQANTADRFGLFNKSYSFGYKRFSKLWEYGVREHLVKKMAIELLGPDGIEIVEVSRRDLFKKNDTYGVITQSSNAEMAMSESKKRTQMAFYSALLNNPTFNQKVVIEQMGMLSDAEPEVIRQLLDVDNTGDAIVMSEAARDIEDILEGKQIPPNKLANAAYKQRFVYYMQDHMDEMDVFQKNMMMAYIASLDEVIVRNTRMQAQEQAAKEMALQVGGAPQRPGQLRAPGPAQPLQDVIQQNVV